MSERKRLLRPPTKITTGKENNSIATAKENNLKRKVSDLATASASSASGTKRVAVTKTVKETVEPKKKKRAAWDVKGRLQDLEDYHHKTEMRLSSSNEMITSLTAKLSTSQTTIDELMQFKTKLESDVEEKNMENSTMEKELEALRGELKDLDICHQKKISDLIMENNVKINGLIKEKEEIILIKEGLERNLQGLVLQNEELKVIFTR